MTKEQFWEQIDIKEEEKSKSEIYLKYRGIEAHDNVRNFLQSLTGTKVSYSSIATALTVGLTRNGLRVTAYGIRGIADLARKIPWLII